MNFGNTIQTNVSVASMEPRQQPSSKAILTSADTYIQRFLKHPHVSIFHSYPEFLHGALLESDKDVETFVPQPFALRVGRRRYTPDCFYRKAGKRTVVEIKPGGEFAEHMRRPLIDFFRLHGIEFVVISNEAILQQERKAINWLYILQILLLAKDVETQAEEDFIWNKLLVDPEREVGDFLMFTGTENDYRLQAALFRFAHRGVISVNDETDIGLDTRVSLCG